MSSSTSSDIFDRLSMFRNPPESGSDDDEQRPPRPKMDPATSRVKRCLFGRGNHEENIRFARRELEKSVAESKRKWNFDFENERPMEGRFEWQSSPYPIFKKKENVENLKPSENPSSKNEHTSTLSDDQNCDRHASNTHLEEKQASDLKAAAETSESTTAANAGASAMPASSSSSNQRTSSRQSSIAEIFRQRKRSKSKVKVQERRRSVEDPTELSAAASEVSTTQCQDKSD